MIKAVIFDFDGVIADTEPVHYNAFKNVLSEIGYSLSEEEYYEKYLAYDDKTLFNEFFSSCSKDLTKKELRLLLNRKSNVYDELIEDKIRIFPGVNAFLSKIYKQYRIAIGSGALKNEIVQALNVLQISKYFEVIVSADEVEKCKPDPEVYLKVLSLLNDNNLEILSPEECVVIEDSIHGVDAAKSAGMRCIAVTNTYESAYLKSADLVVETLNRIDDIMLLTLS